MIFLNTCLFCGIKLIQGILPNSKTAYHKTKIESYYLTSVSFHNFSVLLKSINPSNQSYYLVSNYTWKLFESWLLGKYEAFYYKELPKWMLWFMFSEDEPGTNAVWQHISIKSLDMWLFLWLKSYQILGFFPLEGRKIFFL